MQARFRCSPWSLSWLVVLVLSLVPVTALQAQPLADRVPADAILYVGWEGKSAMGARYEGSKLRAFVETMKLSAEFTRVRDWVTQELAQSPDNVDARRSLHLLNLLPVVWDRPWAFYVRMIDLPKAEFDIESLPRSGALIIDGGTQIQALATQIRDLFAMDPEAARPSIEVAGSWLVVHWNEQNCVTELKNNREPAAGRLSNDPKFKAALKQVVNSSSVTAYYRNDRLIELFNKATESTPKEEHTLKAKRILNQMGLASVKSVIYSAGFEGDQWTSGLFIESPKDTRTGLFKTYLDPGPIDAATLAAIPASASWVRVVRFDIGAAVDQIVNIVRDSAPERLNLNPGDDPAATWNSLNAAVGFDFKKDLLDQLGPDWLMWVDPLSGGPSGLGMIVSVPLKDAVKVEASMSKLETMINSTIGGRNGGQPAGPAQGMRFQIVEQNGVKLHVLNLITVAPAWTIHNGRFYFSPVPQAILSALQPDQSIVANNAVQLLPMTQKLLPPGAQPVGLAAANLSATAPVLYSNYVLASNALSMIASQKGGPALTWMPPPMTQVLASIGPYAHVQWVDDAGFHARTRQPYPMAGMLWSPELTTAAPMSVLTGVAIGFVKGATQVTSGDQGTASVASLQICCVIYSSTHDDKYPPDLATLYHDEANRKNEIISPSSFLAPGSSTQVPGDFEQWPKEKQTQWINQNSSYVLIPGRSPDGDQEKIDVVAKLASPTATRIHVAWGDSRGSIEDVAKVRRILLKQTGKTLEQLGIVPNNAPAPASAPAAKPGAAAAPR